MARQERIENATKDLKNWIRLTYGNCRSARYKVDEDIIDEVIIELKKTIKHNIVKTDATHFEIHSDIFVCYKNK